MQGYRFSYDFFKWVGLPSWFENRGIQNLEVLMRCMLTLEGQLVSLYLRVGVGRAPVAGFCWKVALGRLMQSFALVQGFLWLLLVTTVWYWPKGPSIPLCEVTITSECCLYVQFCDTRHCLGALSSFFPSPWSRYSRMRANTILQKF